MEARRFVVSETMTADGSIRRVHGGTAVSATGWALTSASALLLVVEDVEDRQVRLGDALEGTAER